MKRTFLFACVVAAMASCSKNEVAEINSQDPNIINFSSYVGASTKAGEINSTTAFDAGIYATSKTKTDLTDPFMKNVKLSGQNSSSDYDTNWTTDGVYYWPTEGDVNFYAYAPYSSTATITDAGVLTSNDLAIATNADSQVDILVANAENTAKSENSVQLSFSHTLSRVDFKVVAKATDAIELNLDVESFELVGVEGAHGGLNVKTKGMTSPTNSVPAVYKYDSDAKTISFTLYAFGSTGVTSTQEQDLSSDVIAADAFMLLPQTLTAWTSADDATLGAAAKINYKLKQNGEYIVGTEDVYQTAYFALPTDTSWEAGSSYLYTLTFDAADLGNGGTKPDGDPVIDNSKDAIAFTVGVTEWGTPWYDETIVTK